MAIYRTKKNFSLNIYTKDVIVRMAYDYLHSYNIEIDYNQEDNSVGISLSVDNEKLESDIWRAFSQNLIDNSLRAKVFEQTAELRILLFHAALNESIQKSQRVDINV